MKRVPVLAAAISLLIVGACSPDDPAASTGTITGRLVSGPTCPVETNPPDPGCADQPVSDAEIVATLPDGAEIRARSGQDGRFRLVVPPGVVTITFEAVEGLMSPPGPVTATVEENQTLDLSDLAYDTGIR
jgi:type 1 fimbria pilin